MMAFFFFFFFLIPVIMINYVIFQFYIIFNLLFLIMFNIENFFGNLSYMMGLDFLSYMLVSLSLYITSMMVLSSKFIIKSHSCLEFLFCCFTLCFVLILVFSCLNFLLMYFYFEITLIPLMILILGWGYQPERLSSSLYLFFYTLIGSLPLFIFILYLYIYFGSVFFGFNFYLSLSLMMNFLMMFGFLIKLPMYMMHFWLPLAHVQAPVSGSMVLAGIMLKLGGYGIIRYMNMCELLFYSYGYIWYSFSLIGCLLVSIISFLQSDMKSMVAYSSICHMNLCLISLLTMTKVGLMGGLMMMLGHGLCSSVLFFACNLIYERVSSRSFFLGSGMMNFIPGLSLFMFIICMYNMGCPPSLNFFSEIFIFMSSISYWSNCFLLLMFMSIFSACYSYYIYGYSQQGIFSNIYSFCLVNVCEFLIMFSHLVVLLLLVFKMCVMM